MEGPDDRDAYRDADRDAYFDRWALLHGDYDPRTGSALTRGWLTLAYRLARPLARHGVAPSTVTAATLLPAAGAVATAAYGGRWSLLGVVLIVLSGLLDNLDGAVAVLTQRASARGFVLDSLADRVADGLYLLALWALGAPVALPVAAGFLLFLLEYLRARAGNAGMGEIGVVTVGERPTRVILVALTFLACGVLPAYDEGLAAAGAAALVAVGLVALAQLGAVTWRRLGPS